MIQTEGNHHSYYFNYKITFMCNQNCSYCYEKHQSADVWNSYMIPWRQVQEEFSYFKELEHSSIIEILGGEPLLYPKLNKILEYGVNELSWHTIAVSTNATAKKISSLGLSLDVLQEIKWMFSWHNSETEIERFVENIMYLVTNKIPLQINIMLGEFVDFNTSIFDFLDSLPPEYIQLIELSWLELFDPETEEKFNIDKRFDNIRSKYKVTDSKISANSSTDSNSDLCYYNDVFIDRGQVTSPECVLGINQKFNRAFVKSLSFFSPRKCPYPKCNIINAELCR